MNLSRLHDVGIGVCYCHKDPIPMTGRIITTAGTVECNGLGVATKFSVVQASCGHLGIMITSSSSVEAEGLGVCRMYDRFQGCFNGSLIQGSLDTDSGD